MDAEVSELLKSCYQTAMDTLTQHQDKLNGLAELVREDTEAAVKGMRDLAEIYRQLAPEEQA